MSMNGRRGTRYERRIVLFIDFLGFKELVDRTTREATLLPDVLAAMDVVGKVGRSNKEMFKSQRSTQFSDCMVVSVRVEETSAVFWLLNDVALTIIEVAERGFLLRGAITVGDLLHTTRHVVGPAMVRAYELESRDAIYPRVIVDPDVLKVARASRSAHHSPAEELEYVRSYLTKDDDGREFFDYLSWESVVEVAGGSNEFFPTYFETLAGLIRNGLGASRPGVAAKYLWLHRRYLDTLRKMDAVPPEHGYWRENPGHREAFAGLDRMAELASEARARVALSEPP